MGLIVGGLRRDVSAFENFVEAFGMQEVLYRVYRYENCTCLVATCAVRGEEADICQPAVLCTYNPCSKNVSICTMRAILGRRTCETAELMSSPMLPACCIVGA